jgi:hypothetical protein
MGGAGIVPEPERAVLSASDGAGESAGERIRTSTPEGTGT